MVVGVDSDAMRPEELLGDGAFRDVTQVFQEWALLQVNIHAVSKAVMLLANEHVLIDTERIFEFSAASLEALQCSQTHLLCETE